MCEWVSHQEQHRVKTVPVFEAKSKPTQVDKFEPLNWEHMMLTVTCIFAYST